jgi:D-beta-D-heptose 7-phosphate kinase/D-beta-D-heptose 1-phosphate adenosyltransferase
VVERFHRATVYCAGDVMLDRFVYGSVSRISPEAAVPVIRIERRNSMLGGAESSEAVSAAILDALLERFTASLAECNVALLSHYAKGLLHGGQAQRFIQAVKAAGKPVVVDPQGRDFQRYNGATAIKPNLKELGEAVGLPVATGEAQEKAARQLLAEIDAAHLPVTCGADGMLLASRAGEMQRFPAVAREVFAVSGAGEMVAARPASWWAREAPRSQRRPRSGARFSTRPCAAGRLLLLEAARAKCDRLVVGLNGDASAARLQGPGRPVQDEVARALVPASLRFVDAVILYDDDTPLVKGANYRPHEVVGADLLPAWGGELMLADVVAGHRTSRTLARLAAIAGK